MCGISRILLALCLSLSLSACWYPDEEPHPAKREISPQPPAKGLREGAQPEEPRRGLVGDWSSARPGDWVQFVNVQGGLVVITVSSVDKTGADLRVESYTVDGKPESADKRRVDTTEYFVPKRIDRFSPVEVVFELPADGRKLDCDRHVVVTADRGEESETLICSEVRAGGIVFMRRSVTTYYILLDFGNSSRKPELKWDSQIIKELIERYDRSFSQELSLQEDPPEGEPPEPPED